MADKEMTQWTIYVSVEAKRKFKAICALEGLTLGQKIERLVEEHENPIMKVPAVLSPNADGGER